MNVWGKSPYLKCILFNDTDSRHPKQRSITKLFFEAKNLLGSKIDIKKRFASDRKLREFLLFGW
jgi:hypothetical protein